MEEQTDLNTILNVVCAFDWVTPSIAILQDAAYDGEVSHFGIMAGIYDRGDIWRLLDKHGIESWGYIYNVEGDLIMLSIPETQARRAHYVLKRGGMPVLYTPNDEAPARPSVALGNTFHAGEMRLVKAPSVWGLLKKLLG